jgi:DNA integrity scanning protein DisA with diadenylate cyclase activity
MLEDLDTIVNKLNKSIDDLERWQNEAEVIPESMLELKLKEIKDLQNDLEDLLDRVKKDNL